MIRTTTVRARVNPNTKEKAQKVLDKLGLTVSDAINLLMVQIDIQKALPFCVGMPSGEEMTKK